MEESSSANRFDRASNLFGIKNIRPERMGHTTTLMMGKKIVGENHNNKHANNVRTLHRHDIHERSERLP